MVESMRVGMWVVVEVISRGAQQYSDDRGAWHCWVSCTTLRRARERDRGGPEQGYWSDPILMRPLMIVLLWFVNKTRAMCQGTDDSETKAGGTRRQLQSALIVVLIV